MKLGVIGAGNVGATLGRRWSEAGHEVMYGVRDPSSEKSRSLGNVGSADEATTFADVVVLSLPWTAVGETLPRLPLSGKIVVDCTNPIAADFSGLDSAVPDSAGETVGRLAIGARVVKAFNTTGYNIMANPVFGAVRPAMFLCGDDMEAKDVVSTLSSDIGFEAVDAGPLSQSKYLESAAWLWISMAIKFGHGRDAAYAWLTR